MMYLEIAVIRFTFHGTEQPEQYALKYFKHEKN